MGKFLDKDIEKNKLPEELGEGPEYKAVKPLKRGRNSKKSNAGGRNRHHRRGGGKTRKENSNNSKSDNKGNKNSANKEGV